MRESNIQSGLFYLVINRYVLYLSENVKNISAVITIIVISMAIKFYRYDQQ